MQDLLEWFTYYLQETGPKPSLYSEIQNNRGEWRVEERYPAKGSKVIEMDLGGNNLSLVSESAIGTTVYPGMEATDDWIVFETGEYDYDFRFGGLPQLHMDVTPLGSGGSLYALMEDCDASGYCIHIGHAIMDLRYHAGGDEYQTIIPGQTIRAKMEFFLWMFGFLKDTKSSFLLEILEKIICPQVPKLQLILMLVEIVF